jgi:hypothetical protein
MWKRIEWKAGALFALAFVLFWVGAISALAMAGLILLGGLVSAVQLVLTYLRQAPSLDRFRRLNVQAGIAALGVAGAGNTYLSQARLDLDSDTQDLILTCFNAAIFVGAVGHALWIRFALRRALVPRQGHPDFDEDEQGNPVRAE